MTSDPSLLRFLLDRLEDEIHAIITHLPLPVPDEMQPLNDDGFFDRLLDRRHLYQRVQETKQMVTLVTEAMKEEQDQMLIHDPENVPVTALGSQLIKIWAARYSDHSDYHQDWVP